MKWLPSIGFILLCGTIVATTSLIYWTTKPTWYDAHIVWKKTSPETTPTKEIRDAYQAYKTKLEELKKMNR